MSASVNYSVPVKIFACHLSFSKIVNSQGSRIVSSPCIASPSKQTGSSYCRVNGHIGNNLQENRKAKAKLPSPQAAQSDVDRESQKFTEGKGKTEVASWLSTCNLL